MKTLEEMTWNEFVQWHQAKILMAVPVGKFNEAVWGAMDDVFFWQKAQQDKKEKS